MGNGWRPKYGHPDDNQAGIISVARRMHASYMITTALGEGKPDVVFGFQGVNYVVEVKGEDGKLNPDQQEFHDGWKGRVDIVRNGDDLVRLLLGKVPPLPQVFGRKLTYKVIAVDEESGLEIPLVRGADARPVALPDDVAAALGRPRKPGGGLFEG
jgi:hypothetical protein